ncbi:MAG: mannitol-1-phosphate 5-dehydrogenase [Bacteroidia bacterium]|nr:mannitol-1-phosphate 5-dehydrogenase [Bacteroidia bacterium]
MRSRSSEKSIVIFGAGKIGRSFIGQLFSQAGYKSVFIDIDNRIIDELNRLQRYRLVIRSDKDEVIEVTNVCGVITSDTEEVIKAISDCSIMATCVGKSAFPKILPLIASGIEKRFSERPDEPIDIILAENIRDSCLQMKKGFEHLLPCNFQIDSYIGLIETSIGKMVPIMPKEIENEDPLLVFAEPYNTLILDRNGFKNPIPKVEGLSPKENIKAWVDRKAYIHNLGHAAAAYYGHYKYPERKYLYEVLSDPDVNSFTRQAMKQSAKALIIKYPDEFTENDLDLHINDLINRFQNKALGDTVYRVGRDLRRKLGPEDRLLGAIKSTLELNLPYDKILYALICGCHFKAKDESGYMLKEDVEFVNRYQNDIKSLLTEVCGFDGIENCQIFQEAEAIDRILRYLKC